ncbi:MULTISPECIES: propionate--CoA ligase [unclassified Aureimonas]|uniref:propionate--CoA ligase n=1 Tax=unclassified Aureimonas TaxID=2615206 RepID=UPI0006F7595D|nr:MULTISPECIES: propionate--CoA ligase [unclassified Aureimonas]KQT68988.1 propionate--CoA ligase [Aureimonas sp. Leaf460]KQT69219.1 propionate--CoA ligase [Aureimonas sp. Leaf427]
MTTYNEFYRRSIEEPDAFWTEQSALIDWQQPFDRVCDYDRPPFAKWFVGGRTNLCHNAVDRHLEARGDQAALVAVSSETGGETTFTYRDLHAEVQTMAAIIRSLGVTSGDRVLIYMPMIPEAVFAMLACARIGAVHSVVFGGFASASLASRIDDAKPSLIVSADAGSRGGRIIAYKPLLDEALELASIAPPKVLIVDRGLAEAPLRAGRDVAYAVLRKLFLGASVPCVWLESNAPSYTLYTSGTTGTPKAVQRDTGGYAVALAASMKHIFRGAPGKTFFCTSDIGWVVGHSYIVYGPLVAGMTTILYEGLPTKPDAGIWWRLVEAYGVSGMFSSPTAIRVMKQHENEPIFDYDLSSLENLFLAGEPLDAPTAEWIADALGKPIIDNYWQTESGWPILTLANGVEQKGTKFGSPGLPMYGYGVRLIDEAGEEITEAGRKGLIVIDGPLPPGCIQTVADDDARFVATYWSTMEGRHVYSTFDWGVRDEDGYYFLLGRADDVINTAGHRLGTREIEESILGHSNVAEVAVVGVGDALKGQVAVAFVTVKDPRAIAGAEGAARQRQDILKRVERTLGAIARPAEVHFVAALPKTRSGKLLRRTIQAICEGRDPGNITTIEDPGVLQAIAEAVHPPAPAGRR